MEQKKHDKSYKFDMYFSDCTAKTKKKENWLKMSQTLKLCTMFHQIHQRCRQTRVYLSQSILI